MVQVPAVSARDARLYISWTSDAQWTDISGALTFVEQSGGDRKTEDIHISQQDRPVVWLGKLEPIEMRANVLYEHVPVTLRDLWRLKSAGTPVRLCWIPSGLVVGHLAHLTDAGGLITHCDYPSPSADKAEALGYQFGIVAAGISSAGLFTASGTDDIPVTFWGLLTETGEILLSESDGALIDG